MKRILSAVAAAALGLGLLTACGDDGGGSAGGDYCDDLKAAKKELDSIGDGDFSKLQEATDRMHDLADEAPDEIQDDWEVLVDGIDKLIAALDKAGLVTDARIAGDFFQDLAAPDRMRALLRGQPPTQDKLAEAINATYGAGGFVIEGLRSLDPVLAALREVAGA